MAQQDFEPLTGQLGIAGTSYRLQMGIVGGFWASRMLKGKNILDSYVYEDPAMIGETPTPPNQNIVVGWVLRTVTLPNINPYGIMKTVQALIKQAITRIQQKPMGGPATPAAKVVPAATPISPPISQPRSEDEQRKAFRQMIGGQKQTEPAAQASTVRTTRALPTIPGSSGAPAPSAVPPIPAAPSTPAVSSSEGAKGSPFCPFCGKDLDFKFCPFCGKRLPHEH